MNLQMGHTFKYIKLFKLITFYIGFILLIVGGLSFFLSIKAYFSSFVLFVEWEILEISSIRIIITLLFDWIRMIFIGLVLIISSIVLIYRTYYIRGDKFFTRFIYLVYLFVLSIVFLILSPNIIRILLGWDGLGLVSYCLVIYYQNIKSSNAGIITILSNRIGDVAILLRISWLVNFGRWNFFYFQFIYSRKDTIFIILIVIIAAITKRAQIPFSAWLPAAIAAPTPVSALVHSSTLVTAGVYLLIRFNYILEINFFLLFIGVFTIFISGLGANFENDLKKIIALSTLRQLGLIIITLSLGIVEFSFFHLITHAIFKSILFLCAGNFIHSIGDIQDIRHIGGLIRGCPVTSFYFVISSIALCGFPFLSGFFSKDVILEIFFIRRINLSIFIFIILSTFFTLTYSVRLIYLIYFKGIGPKIFLNLAEESGILLPIRVLILISIFIGCFIRLEFFPITTIYLYYVIKYLIIVGVVVLFLIILYYLIIEIFVSANYTSKTTYFLGSMWFLPGISSVGFINYLKTGLNLVKFLDHGWLEYIGSQNINLIITKRSSLIDFLNLTNMKSYLFIFFFILIILILSL